jgi:hypothetical protein
MKKNILFFLSAFCLLCHKYVNAQNVFPVKEHYDKIYTTIYSPSSVDYSNCSSTGNGLSWVLSSLIRMYETTGDKAYLIKFINHCIEIQNNRWDVLQSGEDPIWVRKTDYGANCDGNGDSEPAYFNSLLIYPMAEFVNIIINDPNQTLYNTNLPIQLINNLPSSPSILGYGDFANWLGKKVEETIIYMNNNYWNDSFGIKNHYSDGQNGTGNIGTVMNFNSPYGSALLYMGLANTNFGYGNNRAEYLYKAQIIAAFYKGDVYIDDKCCKGSDCDIYNMPVLRLMENGNNSYFWFHAGWHLVLDDCFPHFKQPNLKSYKEFVEDISHGAMDLWFVRACYESQLAPCNTCTPYFTYSEMERFRNTLTKNIYYTDINGGHFHNTVNGTSSVFAGGNSDGFDCNPNCPTDLMYGEVLDWMPVYKFDGNSYPNAYDVILNHTTGLLSNSTTENLTGSQSFLGLSEVAKAQWDKECVNLILFNRDIVYNQNFNVKNKITIAPQQDYSPPSTNIIYYTAGVTDPYAEPKVFTDNGPKNRFIVESGTTVNIVAGESIELLPGFEVKAGSTFNALISSSSCTDGMRQSNPNSPRPKDNISLSSINYNLTEKTHNLAVFPNPTAGKFTLNVGGESIIESLSIYNTSGNLVFEEAGINTRQKEVNISLDKGSYIVVAIIDGNKVYKKLVLL